MSAVAFAVLGLRSSVISAKMAAEYNSVLPQAKHRYLKTNWGGALLRRAYMESNPTSPLTKKWTWTFRWMVLAFLLAAVCLIVQR